jgi:hypothetical protein
MLMRACNQAAGQEPAALAAHRVQGGGGMERKGAKGQSIACAKR